MIPNLDPLRYTPQHMATMRASGEYRGKQQWFVSEPPESLNRLEDVVVSDVPAEWRGA